MSNSLPSPSFLGLPEKYSAYRPTQVRAIYDVTSNDRRAALLNKPTGSGKSLIPMSVLRLMQARGLTLTVTRALEDQYEEDLGPAGLADVRGASNYPCPALRPGGELSWLGGGNPRAMADHCAFRHGVKCGLRFGGCPHYDAVGRAGASEEVLTNYAYWLSRGKQLLYGDNPDLEEPLGEFDYLFMDEVHSAADEIGRALQIVLPVREVERLLSMPLPTNETVSEWKQWARSARTRALAQIDNLKLTIKSVGSSKPILDTLRDVQNIDRSLIEITAIQGEWVVESAYDQHHGKVVRFDPVWAAEYAEKLLFRGIPRIVGMSGTVSRKTAKYLGLREDQYAFFEYPSTFDVRNRPVWFMPKVRMHYGNSDADLRIWAGAVDNILRQRDDRKGIIPTVSYKRAEQLVRLSRYSHRMMIYDSKNNGTARAVAEFKASKRSDLVLVGPSIGTGYDFAFTAAEFCIIVKTPWPMMDSKVVKARVAGDKDYTNYYAAQEIMQYAGRIVRDRRDRGETFIIDSSAGGLFKRKDLFPAYFRAAVRYAERVPPAPPKLKEMR